MDAIRASIQRCAMQWSSPLLVQLLTLLNVLEAFREEVHRLQHAFSWISPVAHHLETPGVTALAQT